MKHAIACGVLLGIASCSSFSLPLFDGKMVTDRYPSLAKWIVSAEKYEPQKEAVNEVWMVDDSLVLKPEMKIKVHLVSEATDSIYVIPTSGQIDLPMIRSVALSGKTLGDAKREIEERYKKIYNDPQVILSVSVPRTDDNRKGSVSVAGLVKKPGDVSMLARDSSGEQQVAPETLFLAIMKAGGFEEGAALTQIYILRHSQPQNGVQNIIVSNWIAYQTMEEAVYNVRLRPGDIVIVPKNYPEDQDVASEWQPIADYVQGRIDRMALLNQLNARHGR